jgi:receptor-type tyrosine-protein phosphatase epsilon
MKDLPQNERHWLEQQNISLKKIAKISHSLDKIKPLKAHLSALSQYIKKPAFAGVCRENIAKNRHPKYVPYDENRCCREVANFYISASDVFLDKNYYIATQAPLADTVDDFWFTVVFKNVSLIVSLAPQFEKGIAQCLPYWEKQQFPKIINRRLLERIGEDEILATCKEGKLIKRLFCCVNPQTHDAKIITMLHYENWPDHHAPNPKLFDRLLQEVDALALPEGSPMIVHCMAGEGRTGTFIAAHYLRGKIEEAKANGSFSRKMKLNIPQTIFLMRSQRDRMVSTSEQYQAIHKAIARML